jgi:hypothetical protein
MSGSVDGSGAAALASSVSKCNIHNEPLIFIKIDYYHKILHILKCGKQI